MAHQYLGNHHRYVYKLQVHPKWQNVISVDSIEI